ncbi:MULTISPECIES: ureidoglycolate dehydrogenase [Helcococcus]|uniref:Ureidoglycolate dehydrogenase n=1 Tax=Helcococcus bovis TaxID=3153252 RepID=A0ABW9F4M6_9FIRM
MKITRDELKDLITNKLHKAGLDKKDAELTAECLVWSEERGYHSHGAVRVEYYSERIAKGGINNKPNFEWKETGPASAIFEADNGSGFVASVESTKKAIEMAKKSGIAVVGVRNVSHTGSIGYYTEMAAKEGLVALCMCQSDPMVVPYGGADPYYGTNPIAFSAPSKDGRIIVFDMATTVQAWGKILDKKAKGEKIPDTWAVDENGDPVTDPNKVNSLLPIAGPKGYGLMMMVDIFSGILLGLPFGAGVSSMYKDLSKGRELGQFLLVMDPAKFGDKDAFLENISKSMTELNNSKPATGYDKVYYPGERAIIRKEVSDREGIEVVDEILDYLKSEDVHYNRYDNKNRFAE